MIALSNIEPWAQFGLAGLVIFALFVVLIMIVKWLIAHIDKQAEAHRLERIEWNVANTAQAEMFERSVDKTISILSSAQKQA